MEGWGWFEGSEMFSGDWRRLIVLVGLSVRTEYLRSNGCRGSTLTAIFTTEGFCNGCTEYSCQCIAFSSAILCAPSKRIRYVGYSR